MSSDKPSVDKATAFKFEVNEAVLCYHGPMLYNAKCVDRRDNNEKKEYFIHYNGWNKNWDEWVKEKRLFKITEENIKTQIRLKKEHDSSKKKKLGQKVKKSLGKVQVESPPIKKKKSVVQPKIEDVPSAPVESKLSRRVKISPTIIQWLKTDSAMINKENRLFKLPSNLSIEKILDDFYLIEKETNFNCYEFLKGISLYFNTFLEYQLLYKAERQQYLQVVKANPDVKLSDIYGGPHLLRMLIKFESFIDIKEDFANKLINFVNTFLEYLTEAKHIFSEENYAAQVNVVDSDSQG